MVIVFVFNRISTNCHFILNLSESFDFEIGFPTKSFHRAPSNTKLEEFKKIAEEPPAPFKKPSEMTAIERKKMQAKIKSRMSLVGIPSLNVVGAGGEKFNDFFDNPDFDAAHDREAQRSTIRALKRQTTLIEGLEKN